nr:Receptor-like protein kinase HSL1 [Ipomoea batatas]
MTALRLITRRMNQIDGDEFRLSCASCRLESSISTKTSLEGNLPEKHCKLSRTYMKLKLFRNKLKNGSLPKISTNIILAKSQKPSPELQKLSPLVLSKEQIFAVPFPEEIVFLKIFLDFLAMIISFPGLYRRSIVNLGQLGSFDLHNNEYPVHFLTETSFQQIVQETVFWGITTGCVETLRGLCDGRDEGKHSGYVWLLSCKDESSESRKKGASLLKATDLKAEVENDWGRKSGIRTSVKLWCLCVTRDYKLYKIAVDAAEGTPRILHHDCGAPIVHRDVKVDNILPMAILRARVAELSVWLKGGFEWNEKALNQWSGIAGSCGLQVAP